MLVFSPSPFFKACLALAIEKILDYMPFWGAVQLKMECLPAGDWSHVGCTNSS